MDESKSVVPVGKIENRILLIRGEKVIIDADLAEFYGDSFQIFIFSYIKYFVLTWKYEKDSPYRYKAVLFLYGQMISNNSGNYWK